MKNALFAVSALLAFVVVFAMLGNLADNATSIAQAQAQIETARAAQEAAQAAQIASTGLTILVVVLLVLVLAAAGVIALLIVRNLPAQKSGQALVRSGEQPQVMPGGNMQHQIEMMVQLRLLEMLQQPQGRLPARFEDDEVQQ